MTLFLILTVLLRESPEVAHSECVHVRHKSVAAAYTQLERKKYEEISYIHIYTLQKGEQTSTENVHTEDVNQLNNASFVKLT